MKVLLYKDNTIDLNLDGLMSGLNAASDKTITFKKGKKRFHISGQSIRFARLYKHLAKSFLTEATTADLVICFTKVPYDNNYFFESEGNLTIVSFYAWEQLTQLPLENGMAYFVTSILRFSLPLPGPHQKVTGCINDFLWDKTGIDAGMKSGHFCQSCKSYLGTYNLDPNEKKLLNAVTRLIADLGKASRKGQSIVDYWKSFKSSAPLKRPEKRKASKARKSNDKFAVFLCHNVKDKDEVRDVRERLENLGVRTWFDEEQIRPGYGWQTVLEEQITAIESAAVFVGRSGIGPWQKLEIQAFLSEFLNRGCPVIPVILPNARRIPELPIFLRQLAWVDLRQSAGAALSRLVWGITGKKPKGPLLLDDGKPSMATKKTH
jgi:hypothetical protein